jgi:hypothetical protein
MPATPPFPFKSAPDGEAAHLPAPVMVREPVWEIFYPKGCTNSQAWIQLDTMPIFDREPDMIPNIPGAGYSYNRFIEYLDMGVAPYNEGDGGHWQGTGVQVWTLYCDSQPVGNNNTSPFSISIPDGFTPPSGVIGIPVPNQIYGVSPSVAIDWTVSHSWYLGGLYFDRPAYSEYYINPSTVGIVGFGPSTGPDDPSVPYIIEGVAFGCDERNEAFFPSALFGNEGYWNGWVSAHHGVSDVNGPLDRWGQAYLPLDGPWGSDVHKQALCSPPGYVPCTGASQGGSYLPDQPGGAGDVYGTSLEDLNEVVTYARVQYSVQTTPVTLPGCPDTTPYPIFDPTRTYRATA